MEEEGLEIKATQQWIGGIIYTCIIRIMDSVSYIYIYLVITYNAKFKHRSILLIFIS